MQMSECVFDTSDYEDFGPYRIHPAFGQFLGSIGLTAEMARLIPEKDFQIYATSFEQLRDLCGDHFCLFSTSYGGSSPLSD